MDLHGGQLNLHSEGVGMGSTFTIKLDLFAGSPVDVATSSTPNDSYLPLFNEEKDAKEIVHNRQITSNSDNCHQFAVTTKDTNSTNPLENIRFLLVDDSHMNRKMMVRLLAHEKCFYDQAEDGEIAVKMVMASKRMSETNGMDFE